MTTTVIVVNSGPKAVTVEKFSTNVDGPPIPDDGGPITVGPGENHTMNVWSGRLVQIVEDE